MVWARKAPLVLFSCPSATYSTFQIEEEYNALHRFKLLQTECASPDPSGLAWEASGSKLSLWAFFCPLSHNFAFPVFQKGRPRPLIVAVEFTCGTKPRGSGGAPTWEGEPQGCPGAGMGGGGGTPSFLAMAWLYRWIALGFGCPSTGKGLWLYLKRWSLSPVNTMLLGPVAPAPGGKGSGWAGARTPAEDEEPAAWPGPLNTSLRAWGGRPPPNMWPM